MIPQFPFDPFTAAFVPLATLAATWLRHGFKESRSAVTALRYLLHRPFAAVAAKAQMAPFVQSIATDGIIRAEPIPTGDETIDSAIITLARTRSLRKLGKDFEAHREARLAAGHKAAEVLADAAELAPVMGLAGTLLALAQLSGVGEGGTDISAAIGTAVTSTLYGLLFANLVCAPLARAICRRAGAEDIERKRVIDWVCTHAKASVHESKAA